MHDAGSCASVSEEIESSFVIEPVDHERMACMVGPKVVCTERRLITSRSFSSWHLLIKTR